LRTERTEIRPIRPETNRPDSLHASLSVTPLITRGYDADRL
jgi:hypothetical protein